jgi:hypothetical protein
MHEDPNRESSDPRPDSQRRNLPTNARKDAAIQSAVLALLLDQHPTQLTLAELAREVAADPGDFAQRDAIARAVRDLVGVGLLHRHGDFAIPTRAAVHFDRLESR